MNFDAPSTPKARIGLLHSCARWLTLGAAIAAGATVAWADASEAEKKPNAPVVRKSNHPGVGEMVVVPAERHSVLRATLGGDGKVVYSRRPGSGETKPEAAPAR